MLLLIWAEEDEDDDDTPPSPLPVLLTWLGLVMGVLVLEVRIKALVGLLKISPAGTTKCVPDMEEVSIEEVGNTEEAGIVIVAPCKAAGMLSTVEAGEEVMLVEEGEDEVQLLKPLVLGSVLGAGGGSWAALGGSSTNIQRKQ